ncbi:uncharacterized protein An11g01020 [Aspergillus niger]|uniref:Contig An11c0040, genomic contig n=2 Tax=Aspergillus niger TaxID=5061 RepID=A2QVD6_ASPNC|nr:uncharacterized protein An11g01020 [Aspergillus niger]CAK96893.1 unnamed protein product [Aspergillus niger]
MPAVLSPPLVPFPGDAPHSPPYSSFFLVSIRVGFEYALRHLRVWNAWVFDQGSARS